MKHDKKIYFASDMHFGISAATSGRMRERIFVSWLDGIARDAGQLFLLGDVFDFWFDYKRAVPAGFVRVLGKLAELSDRGIEIHYFAGNHDLWIKDYFKKEIHAHIYHRPEAFRLQGKHVLIGHGDGLGPGDTGYKMLKKIFTNPFSKWLFRWLHPDLGIKLAQYLSQKNKYISGEERPFTDAGNEALVTYCLQRLKDTHFDYFIFGHRHLMLELPIGDHSVYINTGDWLRHFSYAEMSEGIIKLQQYDAPEITGKFTKDT